MRDVFQCTQGMQTALHEFDHDHGVQTRLPGHVQERGKLALPRRTSPGWVLVFGAGLVKKERGR